MSNKPKFTEVTIERAYELADQLRDRTEGGNSTTKVFTGNHPEYGPIHIAIPPAGDSLLLPALLPVVVQQFDL
jgi:hypothetical protein